MHEFDVIARYFTRTARANVDLSVGDDAALVRLAPGCQLAVSTDMSVADTHFFAQTEPHAIGWKAMAVNLSDMAAMGAQPKWATLAIAMPQTDSEWLEKFSTGLFECADAFDVSLIGGDTTRGPLNITITVMGEVPVGKALCRSGAKAGDDVWVSGNHLGAAALWLQAKLGRLALDHDEITALSKAMHYPQPRIALGLALRNVAHSALDLSDGLLADLGHILNASGVGAALDWSKLPKPRLPHSVVSESAMQQAVLSGGDDYELCFTVHPQFRDNVQALSQTVGIPLHRVGVITQSPRLTVMQGDIQIDIHKKGYNHFAEV